MTISAKVIAHSRSTGAPDLITLQLRYPRMIHSEFMTHRVFSRNASSSRAIPIERMIQDVIDDPAMPVAWGSNKPGMQAGDEIESWEVPMRLWDDEANGVYDGCASLTPVGVWLTARDNAVCVAQQMVEGGLHKQIVNRLLEPFGHISVVVTSTEWDNFFDLRCHPDADPTMRALAEAMRDAISASSPSEWDWHMPYVSDQEMWEAGVTRGVPSEARAQFRHLAMISAARCARVSYLNHDGSDPDIKKDLALAERLLTSKHMSPFEHQAAADYPNHSRVWDRADLHGNFTGWRQFRKIIEVIQ